jgi:signal transduction histidine kinase
MAAFAQMIRSFSMPRRVLLGALGASLIAGTASFVAIQRSIEADAKARLEHYARNAQQVIALRIKSYTGLLADTASMMQATELGRDQFRAYVAGLHLDKNYPGIMAVNYAARVPHHQLEAFVTRMRAIQKRERFSPRLFGVWPAGKRKAYWVLTLIEGYPGNYDMFGFDVASYSPATLAALEEAGDTGEISSVGPIVKLSTPALVLATARVPVYRHGMPTATMAQRRTAYQGSLGIAINMPKFMEGVADAVPGTGVRLILDVPRLPEQNRLYDSAISAPHPIPQAERESARYESTVLLPNRDQPWRLTVSAPRSNFYGNSAAYFPWLALVLTTTAAFVVIALLHGLMTSRRQAIGLTHQLRKLAAHADTVKEGERKRIAREIHDDLGQNLLALRIEADQMVARTAQRQPRLHQRARATVEQIDITIRSVRQIINDLRPPALDLGLGAAVAWQVREFERRTGIQCSLDDGCQEVQLDEQYAITLFRVLQEALHNVARHAGPCKVKVTLGLERDCASLTVADNGVGLPHNAHGKAGSFGLLGMTERIAIFGGTCAVSGAPGAGTTVRVTVPLKSQSHKVRPVGSGDDGRQLCLLD